MTWRCNNAHIDGKPSVHCDTLNFVCLQVWAGADLECDGAQLYQTLPVLGGAQCWESQEILPPDHLQPMGTTVIDSFIYALPHDMETKWWLPGQMACHFILRPSHRPVLDRHLQITSMYLNSEELTLLPWWCRGGRRRGPLHHMNDVNLYLGSLRQWGGGVPGQKNAFLIHVFFILNNELNVWNSSAWTYATTKGLKFSSPPPPPLLPT